ncbi:hypothetical protein G9P44_000721 [Scheffersomyces stipitis]|nr:hypothetical protein G9P44_000721 [Scheffersomyces stipitis]
MSSPSPEIKSEDEPRRRSRVRTGCFCCRKRKKKCDESQPFCHACMRNRFKCIYPTGHNEPLPVGFDLVEEIYDEIPKRRLRKRKNSISSDADSRLFNVIVLNPTVTSQRTSISKNSHKVERSVSEFTSDTSSTTSSPIPSSTAPIESSLKLPNSKPTSSSNKKRKIKEKAKIYEITSPSQEMSDSEAPSSPDLSSVSSQSPILSNSTALINPLDEVFLLGNSKYIPNIQLACQDAELYHHFVHNFMPSISLPHAHPLLSPEHVWVQLASQSEILTDIYLCCGASYLAYLHGLNDQDAANWAEQYTQLAETKYSQAVSSLSRAVATKSIDLDSDWLFAACLALCLRDRSFGLNGSRCAQHLIFVYNLIKRRDLKKRETIKEENPFSKDETVTLATKVTPNERSFMDSFVFNYSAALLSCSTKDLVTLPSPFEFFEPVRQWLQYPIYRNVDVKWMNNPVLGSALDSFEVISKLSWLLRLHFNHEDDEVDTEKLLEFHINDEQFWKLVLPLRDDIETIEKKNEATKEDLNRLKIKNIKSYKALRSNLAVSIMTINACKILIEKLINPTIPSFLAIIQTSTNRILEELDEHIPLENHSSCLITLSLFIAGVSTTTNHQRAVLSRKLIEISNVLASNVGKNILKVLNFGWEKEYVDKHTFNLGDKGYKCFDLIFDRPSIESITF